MNIVLLESLGVSDALIAELTAPLLQAGHTFARYERTDDEDELKRRYEPQLRLYARALETLTGRPVKETLICLLRAGRTIAL